VAALGIGSVLGLLGIQSKSRELAAMDYDAAAIRDSELWFAAADAVPAGAAAVQALDRLRMRVDGGYGGAFIPKASRTRISEALGAYQSEFTALLSARARAQALASEIRRLSGGMVGAAESLAAIRDGAWVRDLDRLLKVSDRLQPAGNALVSHPEARSIAEDLKVLGDLAWRGGSSVQARLEGFRLSTLGASYLEAEEKASGLRASHEETRKRMSEISSTAAARIREAIDASTAIAGISVSLAVSVFFVIVALAVAVSLAVAGFFSESITRPLTVLTSSVSRIAKGDYSSLLPEDRSDEIGLLSAGVNTMVRSLLESAGAIRSSQDDLELKVVERSRRLVESEARLRATLEWEKRQRRVIETLRDMSARAQATLDTGEVLAAAVTSLRDLLSCEAAGFLEARDGVLRLAAGAHVFPNAGNEIVFGFSDADPDADPLLSRILAGNRIAKVRRDDFPEGDPRSGSALFSNGWARSAVLLPLGSAADEAGFFVGLSAKPEGFDDQDDEPLRAFAGQASLAVQNSRLYGQAVEARSQADSANKAKSAFLATMSHELRTPLNAILGYSQILARDESLDFGQRQGVGVIERSGRHLLALIDDLLDISRIEAGRFDMEEEPMNPRDALSGLCDMVAVRARSKGLEFRTDLSRPLPRLIRCDQRRFSQVVLNLLTNSIKYTDSGWVGLAAYCEDDELLVEVSDSGIGIDESEREHIFHPFYQLKDRARAIEGVGLGLSISYRIVELMGGSLGLDSEVGSGSTFRIRLPLHDRTVVEAAADGEEDPRLKTRIEGYKGRKRTVFVVDDRKENREVVRAILETVGFIVRDSGTGSGAIEELSRAGADFILIDIYLPDLEGIEVIRRLRSDGVTTPIYSFSASVGLSERERTLAAGGDGFIPKPVDMAQLLETVGAATGVKWTYRAAEAPEAGEGPLLPRATISKWKAFAQAGDIGSILREVDALDSAVKGSRSCRELRSMLTQFRIEDVKRLLDALPSRG
jgi:signal transduction histidine kinase/DNA-binding response OmpR family regulator